MHFRPLYLLLGLALFAGLGAACQSKKKMPAMNVVHFDTKSGAAPGFTVAGVRAEQVNGRINVAIISQEGSMLQLNGLPVADLQAGKVKAASYRVVYMPGGVQPACTAAEGKSRLVLQQQKENGWEMQLQTRFMCGTAPLEVACRVSFTVPEPTYVAPNQPTQ